MVHKGASTDLRIAAALEWARAERDRCEGAAIESSDNADMMRFAMRGAGFAAAIEVLEEVIEPGVHSRRQ